VGDLGALQEVVGGLIWLVIPGIVGMILSIVFGVMLVTGRKLPVYVAPLAVALPALGGLLVQVISFWGWDPAAGPDAAEIAATTVAMARLGVYLLSGPVCVVLVIFCAVAGARPSPRRYRWAAAGAVIIFATSVTTLLGAGELTVLFSQVRAGTYLFLGWMVAVAMMSGNPDESTGPEAGAVAGLTFAIFVATGESALRGLMELLSIQQLRVGEHAARELVVEKFYAVMAPELPYLWAAVVLACVVAIIGLVGAAQGGKRTASAVGAGLWLLLPILLLFNDIGATRMTELAVALP